MSPQAEWEANSPRASNRANPGREYATMRTLAKARRSRGSLGKIMTRLFTPLAPCTSREQLRATWIEAVVRRLVCCHHRLRAASISRPRVPRVLDGRVDQGSKSGVQQPSGRIRAEGSRWGR